jgi:predicted nucleic acid-binding protein
LIVVDTSAVVAALLADPPDARLGERMTSGGSLHAPHLIDVEFIAAVRRMAARRLLSNERAEDARRDYADLTIVRYPHVALADRMWSLREKVSAYDGAFVALAEILDVPLITADRRLGRASGHDARVEVF